MIVNVIKVKKGQALIEWADETGLHRGYVPSKDVENGDVKNPERAAPYGVDFAKHIKRIPKAADFARALNNVGIWTYEDLEANPSKATGVILQVYGPVLNQILTGIKGEENADS